MNKDVTHEEEYKGYTIEIVHDPWNENPFDNWDCEPPLVVDSGYTNGLTEYATKYGTVGDVPWLSKSLIKKNLKDILSVVGYSTLVDLIPNRRDFGRDEMEDCINEAIAECVNGMYNSDKLKALRDLYNMLPDHTALLKTVRGYSQGDWLEVLAVATPEFQKACGNAEGYWDDPEKLKGSIDLFRFWAFGDVWGYNIPELEDSCFGYYGDYPEYGGAVEEARNVIDRHIEHLHKQHLRRVKNWVRHRVPLLKRVLEER